STTAELQDRRGVGSVAVDVVEHLAAPRFGFVVERIVETGEGCVFGHFANVLEPHRAAPLVGRLLRSQRATSPRSAYRTAPSRVPRAPCDARRPALVSWRE